MATKLAKKYHSAKPLPALAAALLLSLLLCLAAWPARAGQAVFAPLRADLLAQGLSTRQVDHLLADRRLAFEGKLLARLLSVSESKLNYAQFLKKGNLKQARRFMGRHRRSLRRAEQVNGVDGPVVVAILSVESRFGAYTGRYRTFNVLASQAVLDTARARRELARHWPKGRVKELAGKHMRGRLARRAGWARGELAALVRLAGKMGVDPYKLRGSPFGALGMCQFVPSSVLSHGKDGDKDGRVDLAQPADAIMSVSDYLARHGWRRGLSYQRQVAVIMKYNNSTPYARTVLELARRLR